MERERWDERYESGDYTPREAPSDRLQEYVDWAPDGRALDVATGTGRNALFLAEHGYDVDAIDVSGAALSTARERADEQGVDVNWIQADIESHAFPAGAYDLVVVCFYHSPALVPKLVSALAPGGVLVYEHHVRTESTVERGPGDEHRYRVNDLLRYCLGLTVFDYRETVRTFGTGERAGSRAAVATLVARKSHGGRQDHPPAPGGGSR